MPSILRLQKCATGQKTVAGSYPQKWGCFISQHLPNCTVFRPFNIEVKLRKILVVTAVANIDQKENT